MLSIGHTNILRISVLHATIATMRSTLKLITGPMFSGKSEELVRHLRRYTIANIPIVVLNHALDIRYGVKKIVSHSKESWDSVAVKESSQILSHINSETKTVIIDEVQFFDSGIIAVISRLRKENRNVIAAGLDTDFRGKPFGPIPELLALAEEVIKLKAVCAICNEWNATRTQRLLKNGKPAPYSDPLIKVGAHDSYQARCIAHHEVPGEPNAH